MYVRHLGVTAVSIIEVVQYVVALGMAEPIPAVPGVATALQAAVTPIVASEGVLTLGVAVVIADFAWLTVYKHSPLAQCGIVDLVDAQLPADVVAIESCIQLPVLPLDLLLAHGGIQTPIITDVHHLVPDHLLSPKGPVLIVLGYHFHIVTGRLSTKWRL